MGKPLLTCRNGHQWDPTATAAAPAACPACGSPPAADRADRTTSLPPPPGDALPPETPFGRYRIVKPLGRGGMGSVYLAHDTKLDRRVALKVPHLSAADGSTLQARFLREARAAATIDHPNVCPVYDAGEVDGVPYLTMAYVEGRPLSDLIRPDDPPPPHQSAALVRTIALALHEAHARGVVHRDLKPSNVMLGRRGEPVVMDFGLARRDSPHDARLTQSGAVVGTPAYMAPEQVSGDPVGPAGDVYSLGVILYELLTGRRPFDGPATAVLGQILFAAPVPPGEHRRGLDPRLEAACLKALAKKPADRYTSMAEFAAALSDHLHPAAPPAPGEGSRKAPRGRRRWWVIAAGVCAALAVAAFLYTRPAGPAGETAKPIALAELVNSPEMEPLAAIATDGTNLYAAAIQTDQQKGRVFSIPLGGGPARLLYTAGGPLPGPIGLTALGPDLFWIDGNAGPVTDTQVFKAPKSGAGPVKAIYTGSAVGEPIVDGGAIATDGEKLYAADMVRGRVYRLNPDGTGRTQLGKDRYPGFFDTARANYVAVSRGTVYVCDAGKPGGSRPQVVGIPTSGGAFTPLHSGPPLASPRAVAVGGSTVFVADPDARAIWTLPTTVGGPKQLLHDERLKRVSGIAYHDTALYAATVEGAVYKIDFAGTGFVP